MLVRALAIALILPLTSACFLKPKKKSGKKANAASSLIARDSIFMDRIGDGDSARLTFKTKIAAQCAMAFYSQDQNGTPTKDQPTVVPCAQGDARTEFVEELKGLQTDTLYYVLLTAWEGGSTKEHGDLVTIKETPNSSSVITPGGEGDGLFRDLMVARLDIPLGVAEVHRHAFDQPTDAASIKTKLNRTIGCQQGVPTKDAPFRDAAKDIVIQNLATRDFAAGNAAAHPDYPGRLQLTYPSVNEGVQRWTFLYTLNGKDILVPIRPIRTIVNMEMESGDAIMNFDKPQLADAVDPLKIDPTKVLKFSWTTENQPQETAYVTVQIGRPDYDKSIYCIFPADKLSGEVDAKLLQNLDDGKQVVLAEMASNQLWVKDGWLVTVYDWRSGRIEK